MMRVLYCIVADPAQRLSEFTAGLEGIEGQPVDCFSSSGLTGVTTPLSSDKIVPSAESLLAHQKLVDAIFQHNNLIPMRFGTIVKSADELMEHLNQNAAQYQMLLAELDNCVEMGVRILSAADAPAKPHEPVASAQETAEAKPTGREFLSRRKTYYDNKELMSNAEKALIDELKAALRELYVTCKIEARQPNSAGIIPATVDGRKLISAYFLVQRSLLPQFKAALQALPVCDSRSFSLSGPWPPYNFIVKQTDQSAAVIEKQLGMKND